MAGVQPEAEKLALAFDGLQGGLAPLGDVGHRTRVLFFRLAVVIFAAFGLSALELVRRNAGVELIERRGAFGPCALQFARKTQGLALGKRVEAGRRREHRHRPKCNAHTLEGDSLLRDGILDCECGFAFLFEEDVEFLGHLLSGRAFRGVALQPVAERVDEHRAWRSGEVFERVEGQRLTLASLEPVRDRKRRARRSGRFGLLANECAQQGRREAIGVHPLGQSLHAAKAGERHHLLGRAVEYGARDELRGLFYRDAEVEEDRVGRVGKAREEDVLGLDVLMAEAAFVERLNTAHDGDENVVRLA